MRRKMYDTLLEWKQNKQGSTALLIEGARRVGKSYLVEEFARQEYRSYILLDFNLVNDDVRRLFTDHLDDPDTFFSTLSAITGVRLYPRESLIILDEVQLFPRARAAVKYLVADGRYDYIETGSLISLKKNVQDILIPSEEHHIYMYPMDFEEYLWAVGNDTLFPAIRMHFAERTPMGQALHRKTMEHFRRYMLIGGMPKAVSAYCEQSDFPAAEEVKQDILSLYRSDIVKYAGDEEEKVTDIFQEIPSRLREHDKRFHFSDLGANARFREYKDALSFLDEAMMINIARNSSEPSIGLAMNEERMTRKCYMGDTGLLVSMAFGEHGTLPPEIYQKILFDKLEFNSGMLTENIVAQMLKCSGHRLFFYSNPSRDDKDARMEIDFLITKKNVTSRHNISPIEVKSGKNYTLTSLRKCMTKYHEQLHVPYVMHSGDVKEADGIVYLPLYMAGLL